MPYCSDDQGAKADAPAYNPHGCGESVRSQSLLQIRGNSKQVHQAELSQYCSSGELNWCKLTNERTKPMRLFRHLKQLYSVNITTDYLNLSNKVHKKAT